MLMLSGIFIENVSLILFQELIIWIWTFLCKQSFPVFFLSKYSLIILGCLEIFYFVSRLELGGGGGV